MVLNCFHTSKPQGEGRKDKDFDFGLRPITNDEAFSWAEAFFYPNSEFTI